MDIFKLHVVDMDVRATDMTTFSDTHKVREITSINLTCEGELKDGTTVRFGISTTQQERESVIRILDDVLRRFRLENGTVSEHNFEKKDSLAGIKYDDG